MSKFRLVVAGAYYKAGDRILVPHYTGEFRAVDCDVFLEKDDLPEYYNETEIESLIKNKNYIEVEGIKYYYATYKLYNIDKEWELLSDLSKLKHIEKDFNF